MTANSTLTTIKLYLLVKLFQKMSPCFLLRARDYLVIPLLEHYRSLCVLDGCNDYQLALLDKQISDFKKWSKANPNEMKQLGITRGLPYRA